MIIRSQFQLYATAYGLTLVACVLSWLLLRSLLASTSLPVEIYASLTSDLAQRWILTAILISFPLAWLFARSRYQLYLSQGGRPEKLQIDPTTGLLNRSSFCQLAEDSLRMQSPDNHFGLLLLDVDYFSELSDSYGYKIADGVLDQLTDRLAGAVREGDLLCRFEGEKFALFAKSTSPEQLYRLAERLLSAIGDAPYSADGSILEITASCGLADTWICTSFDDLLQDARKSLLQSKMQRQQLETLEDAPQDDEFAADPS